VVIPKKITFLLLVLMTIAIAAITLSLSGKAYAKVDPIPFREIRLLITKLGEHPLPVSVIVALLMPAVANMLLFLPWGFLMFILLDDVERPTNQAYLLTLLLAIAFSAIVEASQYFLPTRVTDVNDVIWNGVGALVGAFLGHLRKRIRVSFQ
ncbi:MAG: VanZ family protein, partial [Thermoanaerobaculia bacterium]